jgi:predicted Zn-dependent protease
MATPWMARILEAARDAGCSGAEVFVKQAQGRQIILEPGPDPVRQGREAHPARDLDTPPTVSRSTEAGAGLRVVDREGRRGFAWIGLGDPVDPEALVHAALTAARHSTGRAGDPAWVPLAEAPGRTADTHSGGQESTGETGGPFDSGGIVDPVCLTAPVEEFTRRLREGAGFVARESGGTLVVDRMVFAEASTTLRIASTRGFDGCFERTIALLSVSLVPAAEGAAAAVEERAACGPGGLDVVECAREAVLRAMPAREPVDPWAGPASVQDVAMVGAPPRDGAPTAGADAAPGGSAETMAVRRQAVRLVLSPRASATLVAALAPWVVSGGMPGGLPGGRRRGALCIGDDATVPGRPGSGPFDGAGRPTRRTLLVEGGCSVGRITASAGHVLRASYRDLPAPGAAALVVAPGIESGDPGTAVETPGSAVEGGDGIVLRSTVIEVHPGATWRLVIRRGDWWRSRSLWSGGERIGPADGLLWEGHLQALAQAIVATGADTAWFECGVTIATPSMRIEGLSPWVLEPGGAGRP